MTSRRLVVPVGALAVVLTTLAVVGVFAVAPEDADQGIIQKIFYFHTSIALGSLVAFAVAFASVRVAQSFVHPVVFTRNGANLPGSMLVWFVVSQAAVLAIFATFLLLELEQRRADRALRRLKLRFEALEPAA